MLQGLVDLNTEKESVQARIADYLTDLISIGFSGFRSVLLQCDAARFPFAVLLTCTLVWLESMLPNTLPLTTWSEF